MSRYRYVFPAPEIRPAEVWREIFERDHTEEEMAEIRERFEALRKYVAPHQSTVALVPREILGPHISRRQWAEYPPEIREALIMLYLSRDVAAIARKKEAARYRRRRPA